MKKIIIIIFIICTTFIVQSQEKYKHSTPQAAEIIKQGEIPVSLYNGKLNLAIPIYDIKDPDFNIPVSVSYNSGGFQPQKHAGTVGLNWTLIAGGCITREVYLIPDDYKETVNLEYNHCNGFIIQSRISVYNKDDIFNMSPTVGTLTPLKTFLINGNSDFDYMPDMFNFNFNGQSGSFIVGNDGKVKMMSDAQVEVDLSEMQGFQPVMRKYLDISGNEISEIKITDVNGYQYFFGGDMTSIEFTLDVICGTNGEPADNTNHQQNTPTINSWYLRKIIAPNGRVVEFNYMKSTNNTFVYQKDDPIWLFTKKRSPLQTGDKYSKNAVKSVVLKSISIPDINFNLNFNNEIEQKRFFYEIGDFSNKNYQLKSIVGKIDNDTLINSAFNYEYFGGNTEWGYRFLKDIKLYSGDKYSFDYIHPTSYPNPMQITRSDVDDYGFWKSNSLQGLIHSVTYPTSGKSVFEFEQNDYGIKRYYSLSRIDEQDQISHKLIETVPTVTGGARIKSVKNYEGINLTGSKIYNYTDKFDYEMKLQTYDEQGYPTGSGNGGYGCINEFTDQESEVTIVDCDPILRSPHSTINSSGILLTNSLKINYLGQNPKWIKTDRQNIYNIEPCHIGYGQVTEITIDNLTGQRSYKHLNFSDYVYNNDTHLSNSSVNETDIKLLFLYQYGYSSMSFKRGKLIKETGYNNAKQISYFKQNAYMNINETGNSLLIIDTPKEIDENNNLTNSNNYFVTLQNFQNSCIAKKVYYAPMQVSWRSNTEMRNSELVDNITYYKYDTKNRIIEEKSLDSKNRYIFKQYKYPDQIIGVNTSFSNDYVLGYMNLVNRNIISRPVEVVHGIIDGGLRVYTGSELILYKPISTLSSISAPYRKLSLQIPYPVSNYSFANVLNGNLIYDTRMSLISEFEYSNLLRLNKITEVGQLPINYTWDSKMLYPKQVTQGVFTSTYTYKALVGITSATDPRGVTTYYEYDSFNRLKQTYLIENGEKKILQKYDYHYANQQ